MATLGQRAKSESALYKARYAEKSNLPVNGKLNLQINSERNALPQNQSGNWLQLNCDGLTNFAMRFFDEEAMRAYVQILHDLIERLSGKQKICEDTNFEDNLRIRKEKKYVPRMQNGERKTKKNLVREGSLPRKVDGKKCTFCDQMHDKGKQNCKAYNRICHKCKQYNHFAVVCRTKVSGKSKYGNTGVAVSKCVSEVEKQPATNERVMLKKSSDYKDSKTRREEWNKQSILNWINKKLNANHCALVELKDGKELNKLVGKVLGYEYSGRSAMPWQELEDVLLIEDMETHIPLDELKCCNEDALMKLIKWLQEEETKRSR